MELGTVGGTPWTFGGESARTGDGAVTLIDGTTFLVSDATGDIARDAAHGLFLFDTRVLSTWRLRVNGRRVDPLAVSQGGPFSATFVGRLHEPDVVDAPIAVVQRRYVGRGMREDLEFRNYAAAPAELHIELMVACDFGSVFDVKAGSVPDDFSGRVVAQGDTVRIERAGAAPGQVDATVIGFGIPPDAVGTDIVEWAVTVPPGGTWSNSVLVGVGIDGTVREPAFGYWEPVEDAIPASRLRHWQQQVTTIESDWAPLSRAADRASEDLGGLRIFDPDHPERVVVAAGAPWFMTLFGRDSLLTAWMALVLDHGLASGVLGELADAQGRVEDPASEEQPGRILHEVRFDSRASRLLGGRNIYYGTIDATPLFVMTVAELARWTGPTATISELMPAVDRALSWIDTWGDRDGDGFVEYLRDHPGGLANQGWKDSWDGVRHRDGRVAGGPIALCEVQGYVYAALRGRAELARALGEPDADADVFDARADALRAAFDEAFWMEHAGWYALALDGDKRQVGSLTSNIGHLLWTGIVPPERAEAVAEHLAGPGLFSGWGVRTLASDNGGYNPLSYHCGSVWPHDTAIAVAGLARYGCDAHAARIGQGLLSASEHSGGRLPELFAGFANDDMAAPVPYPASCSPQAWAAASPLLVVRAMLGLEPDLLAGRLRLRPRLFPGVRLLRVTGMPLGDRTLTITATAEGVEVGGPTEGLEIEIDEGEG